MTMHDALSDLQNELIGGTAFDDAVSDIAAFYNLSEAKLATCYRETQSAVSVADERAAYAREHERMRAQADEKARRIVAQARRRSDPGYMLRAVLREILR